MRHIRTTLALIGLAFGASSPAAAEVRVDFLKPSGFSDANDAFGRVDQNLEILASYLEQLGQRYLPSDRILTITVLDVDLSGNIRPRGSRGDLRILNGGADWPRIKIRYSLQDGDRQLASGEESIADMQYMLHTPTAHASESLYHEKRMLKAWFVTRFADSLAAVNN